MVTPATVLAMVLAGLVARTVSTFANLESCRAKLVRFKTALPPRKFTLWKYFPCLVLHEMRAWFVQNL